MGSRVIAALLGPSDETKDHLRGQIVQRGSVKPHCPLKLTAYFQKHGWTDFLADAVGHVAGEWPLIVTGHPNSQVGASVADLDPITTADHAVAAVQPGV